MTNFDILRSADCMSTSGNGLPYIAIKFKSNADMHKGFDALMDLMRAEIERIDIAIDKPTGIDAESVNAVHDAGVVL